MKTASLALALAAAAPLQSPYAGQQQREIKALSAEEVHGLREGAGLGFAKAAELNGYPGPKHVLELAGPLRLSAEQRRRVESIHELMRRDAIAAGERLIAEERALDELFASGTADEESLGRRLDAVAEARARVRLAHLTAHLATRRALDAHQVARYGQLRGYEAGSHDPRHH